jgi:hypothetical protein
VIIKVDGRDIVINAAEIGLVDLDEYLPCKELAEKLLVECGGDAIRRITLDLQHCWLEYSFSYLFLDVAIEILNKSRISGQRQLVILVSIDLGEAHFMATLLFRMSRLFACENESDPAKLLKKIDEICAANGMSIIVKSRVQNPDAPEPEAHSFIIGGSAENGAISG